MPSTHSYEATLKNNRTENDAISFLLKENSRLRSPSKEERKEVLSKLELPSSFSRAFDLVLIPENSEGILSVAPSKWVLIELKTTQKKHEILPNGFFFGATENEFKLADRLGDRYQFCFVSLHPESRGYCFVGIDALEKMIKTKRIQYQINLHK